jgi:preprotein translocase SecE subunit
MGKHNDRRHGAGRAGSVAEPDSDGEESAVSDLAPDAAGGDEPQNRGERTELPYARKTPRPPGAGFRIYKPGQGYHVRVGTAIGAAVLIVAGAAYLYEQLGNLMTPGTGYYWPVRYGVSVTFLFVMSVLTYWVVGVNRRANDFFIATEGEMKKVNWSTRREVIRSTKVVIVTVVLMAALLFVVDVLFMMFFSSIEVLQASPGLKRLFGAEE